MVWQYIKSRSKGFSARSKSSWLHSVKHGWRINSCHSFADVSSNKSASEADSSPALSCHPLKLWQLLFGWEEAGRHVVNLIRNSSGSKNCLPTKPIPWPALLHRHAKLCKPSQGSNMRTATSVCEQALLQSTPLPKETSTETISLGWFKFAQMLTT